MLIIQYIKNVCHSYSECGYKHPKVKTGTTLVKCGFKKIVLTKIMSCIRPIPPLPLGTRPMEDQVAGHKYSDGKLGCLQHDDGTLLKPVQVPPKGQREVNFYQKVFNPQCQDKTVLELRSYIPQFYGLVTEGEVSYLKLENLLFNISKPCVLDIKMGKITYDPEATKEKKALEIAKFPPLTKLGYQLSGMQIFNPKTKEMVKLDKFYCKKLTEDTMISEGLARFFPLDENDSKEIISAVIDRLESIKEWFTRQRSFAFYASSILIVFDGDISRNCTKSESLNCVDVNRTNKCSQNDDTLRMQRQNEDQSPANSDHLDCDETRRCRPKVEVRMIDFTHVFPSQEMDSNYLFGLTNLISHLRVLTDSAS